MCASVPSGHWHQNSFLIQMKRKSIRVFYLFIHLFKSDGILLRLNVENINFFFQF